MVFKKGFFEDAEFTVIEMFEKMVKNQPPLEEVIEELNNNVTFEKQGDAFRGVSQRIGVSFTNYCVLSEINDLRVFRGIYGDTISKVAHYSGKNANDFYKQLKSKIVK